jgi:hypothetical protein
LYFCDRLPDAVAVVGADKLAIELELTAKSGKRYREIILQYQMSKTFKRVLYVVGGDEIAAKIAHQITQQRRLLAFPYPLPASSTS